MAASSGMTGRAICMPCPKRYGPRGSIMIPGGRACTPTIWRRPDAHPAGDPRTAPAAIPQDAPAAAPAVDPALAAPAPADPAAPQPPATADAAPPPAAGAPAAAPQAVAPAVAQAAAKLPVLVVGDNIGYHLAQGLIDTETDGGIGLAISRKTKDSSGLVREDFYDWQKNLRDILAATATMPRRSA